MEISTVTDEQVKNTESNEPGFPNVSPGQLAMYVGLASLTVLFTASLVAFYITRAQAQAWRPADLPPLPWGLWLNTLVLALLSIFLRRGEKHLHENLPKALGKDFVIASLLSIAFLALQALNWREVAHAALQTREKTLYVYTFYSLTVLHALHVVGGIAPLLVVARRAPQQYYAGARKERIKLVRQYWDFLFIVWVILLLSLWFS